MDFDNFHLIEPPSIFHRYFAPHLTLDPINIIFPATLNRFGLFQ